MRALRPAVANRRARNGQPFGSQLEDEVMKRTSLYKVPFIWQLSAIVRPIYLFEFRKLRGDAPKFFLQKLEKWGNDSKPYL